MASLTVTVHTRGRRRLMFLCQLTRLLLWLHCYRAVAWVTSRMGLWLKVDAGRHAQWQWHSMGITMTREPKAVQDG